MVDTGSIVKAATKLHLTQPGITRRVQNLESRLATELLDRNSKPLKPTAAGREIYELGKRVLSAVDDLLAAAGPNAEPGGELRVGVPPFLSELALGAPVDKLREAFPNLALRVIAGWSPGLLQMLRDARLDVAAVLLPTDSDTLDGLQATLVRRQPIMIIAARDAPIPTHGVPLARLSEYPWILNQDGCGMRSSLTRAFAAARLPFTVAVEALGSDLQQSLIARGIGIGVTTPQALERGRYRDRLKVIKSPDYTGGLDVWLAHGALPRRLLKPVELLRDTLANAVSESHTL